MSIGFLLKYWHWGALGLLLAGLIYLVVSRDNALEKIGSLEKQVETSNELASEWEAAADTLATSLTDITIRLNNIEARAEATREAYDRAWQSVDRSTGQTELTVRQIIEAPAVSADQAVAAARLKLKDVKGVGYVEVPAVVTADSLGVRDDQTPVGP
jgi:hypothetical protein